MITFETQEAFDSAVMAAVERCLRVKVVVSKEYYSDNKSVEVSLMNYNKDEPVEFSQDSDTVYLD